MPQVTSEEVVSPRPQFIRNVVTVTIVAVCAAVSIGLLTGSLRFVHVISGSMKPQYVTGSYHLCVRVPQQSVQVGDVVVVTARGGSVMHRVLFKRGDLLTLKGDANEVSDTPVNLSALQCKVLW